MLAHQAFQLHLVFDSSRCGRGDLCGQFDLEITQSIGLAGEFLKKISLRTDPLSVQIFRFLRGPQGMPREGLPLTLALVMACSVILFRYLAASQLGIV